MNYYNCDAFGEHSDGDLILKIYIIYYDCDAFGEHLDDSIVKSVTRSANTRMADKLWIKRFLLEYDKGIDFGDKR